MKTSIKDSWSITVEYWGQFITKKLSTRILYPFLFSFAFNHGQIVFKPLAIICKSFAKKSVDLYAFQVNGCDPFFYFYTACSLIAKITMLAPNWPNFLVSGCKIGQWNKSWPAGEIEFANFCLMLIIFNQSWWFFVIVFARRLNNGLDAVQGCDILS